MDEFVSVGWAIAIEYALKNVSHQHRLQAADVVWTPLELIKNHDILVRAFGGPQISLVGKLNCSESIQHIDEAWKTSAQAVAEFQGYLQSARVAADYGAHQAKSRQAAYDLLSTQVSLLTERMGALRDKFTAYRNQIVDANLVCGRDIDAIKEAIGKLPQTDNNKQLAVRVNKLGDKIEHDLNIRTHDDIQRGEYELQRQMGQIAAVGSPHPSHSIDSNVQIFTQYVDVMQSILESGYMGVYKNIYRDLESTLQSYELWIDSTNRQPWDR
jgi:tRNA(Ser,Leu) C12 N-acetylase TAN1